MQATAYKVGKAGFKSQTSKNKTESKGTSPRNREVWATAYEEGKLESSHKQLVFS